ncbi:MAG: DUF202 domain-containing protein [Pseudomonadota bacterium]|nr:DUF202 domain-containing protein [Pseudomonadota bacterium]
MTRPEQDPRIFFAAERTLLAWNRTSLAAIAFGFLIERSGLLIEIIAPEATPEFVTAYNFFLGLLFILIGVISIVFSTFRHQRFIKTLALHQLPKKYSSFHEIWLHLLFAVLGLGLAGLIIIKHVQ